MMAVIKDQSAAILDLKRQMGHCRGEGLRNNISEK